MKVVIDTNCLVVSVLRKSPFYWLFEAFRKGRITLCYTTEILEEYHEILGDFYSTSFAENVINEIINSPNIEQVTVFYKWNLITKDPDDNKFVDCAISCNATYLVTNDKHFKELDIVKFPKVQYLTIEKFQKILF